METSEFQEDVYYSGTVEDPARYRISLNDHKTAGVYGAAVVRLYDDLYKLIEMYLRTVRNQITTWIQRSSRYSFLVIATSSSTS